jgi:hypothetical protein
MATQPAAFVQDFAPVAKLFSELDEIIQTAANGRMTGFAPITLRLPVAQPPIHYFYTMVSWLYVLVIESGSVHFKFLAERASALGADPTSELQRFCDDVRTFRTVLQHNLDLADSNDFAKLDRCEKWMATILERKLSPGERFWPGSESQWSDLAVALRERARRFGEANVVAVNSILNDEFVEDVLREWIFRQTRCIHAHEFDAIVAQVASDMGLKHLDAIRLRQVRSSEWNRRIRLLSERSDIKWETRRLVEQSLLEEAENYLPVTGADLIEILNVPPGPEVGKVLRLARELYRKTPYSRDDLLQQLRFPKK